LRRYTNQGGILRAEPFKGEHKVRPYMVPPKSNRIPSSIHVNRRANHLNQWENQAILPLIYLILRGN